MRTRVCFVVPAHGRLQLARICLTNLRDVCAEINATAVVVACDENILTAEELGFQTVVCENRPLGRRFNEGFARACRIGDFVMPLGSDDLITAGLVTGMLEAYGLTTRPNTVVATRSMAALAPNGRNLTTLRVPYEGGAGPRLFASGLLARVGYRPAEEHRDRAIDGSIQRRLSEKGPLQFLYVESGPLELTDCKTEGANLNTYEMLMPYAISHHDDPWEQLRTIYPTVTVDALEALYSTERTPHVSS